MKKFCIIFILGFLLVGSAGISYQSLEYGVPQQISSAPLSYIYFNTTLNGLPTFLVLTYGETMWASSVNPAPNASNSEYQTISRTKTNTLEVWIPFTQEGQVLYIAAQGPGSLTLSSATDLDSLPVNSMNLTAVDVQIPPNGRIWFQYRAPQPPANVFWFYPVLCSGDTDPSHYEFIAYPGNTTNSNSDSDWNNCDNENLFNIYSSQFDLPDYEYNNDLVQRFLCPNSAIKLYMASASATTLFVSISASSSATNVSQMRLYYWKSDWSDNFDASLPTNLLLYPIGSNADMLMTFDAPQDYSYNGANYTLQLWMYMWPYYSTGKAACYITDSGTNSTMWPLSEQRNFSTSTGDRWLAVIDLQSYSRNSQRLSNRVCGSYSCSMTVIMTLPNALPIAFVPVQATWLDTDNIPVPNWSGTSLAVVLILAMVIALSIATNVILLWRFLSKQAEYVPLSR